MGNPTFSIHYTTRSQKIKIYALADIHYGSPACDREALSVCIQTIQSDPFARWIGLGDYVYTSSKRGQLSLVASRESRELIGLLNPIAHQCIGLIEGNCEIENARQNVYEGMIDSLARGGNIDPAKLRLGRESVVQLSIARFNGVTANHWRYRIYAAHDVNHYAQPSDLSYELIRTVGGIDTDIVIEGHTHTAYRINYPMRRVNQRGLFVNRDRYGIFAPAMMTAPVIVSDHAHNDRLTVTGGLHHKSERATRITLDPLNRSTKVEYLSFP